MSTERRTRDVLLGWLDEGRRIVAATVVEATGSAPLPVGATMLVDGDGNVEGSVTGGCVEGALVEEARLVLASGKPVLRSYGITDQLAGDVGLMCGGRVRIFVAELAGAAAATLAQALRAARGGRPVAIATVLEGAHAGSRIAIAGDVELGSTGGPRKLDQAVIHDARGLLAEGVSAIRRYGAEGSTMGDDVAIFMHSLASPPRMVIFGAIDFSSALAVHARELGYRVTICDPRRPFAVSDRFGRVAEVIVDWPDRYLARQCLGPRDAVLVFSHDPKLDEPALVGALATGAGYIGALGSRSTHRERIARLRAAGVDDEGLARIVSPCGLDLGGGTPNEAAISILAELIALRTGRSGVRLVEGSGTIRPRLEVAA